ncbi:MAG: adenosylmethionine-8-amino-7-oxononanoate aminotransferase [Gammaproteobacteria bacterium]|jgi:adenosylmethionine-8-amino-7-oxononanoate aminotransferase
MNTERLIELDRAHLFHPVLSPQLHEKRGAIILESGHGAYVKDAAGNELLDGFAGLWCVNAGYGQQTLIDAATKQLEKLPYATGYFHFSSEPTIELAAKLAARAPGDLNRVYFTLGGSDAIDSALRLIHFYFNVLGKHEKKNYIALERGYHGSSSNGAGLTALPAFHQNFGIPHPWQHHIPSPYPYRNGIGLSDQEIIDKSVQSLKNKVAELGGSDQVAAFFCEPVQGSGGIIVYPKGYMKSMRNACRELDILFLADEVITGFGRTGPMFACNDEDVVPDLMTVAKGLTSGYAPMGALFISESIYQTISDGAGDSPVGHGFTYSGHPVSAAVALATIELYEEGGLFENGVKVGKYFAERLDALAGHPLVGEIRIAGMLAGVELVVDKVNRSKAPASSKIASRMFETAYSNGLIFRAFADDIIGFAPPLCCTETDIDILIERFEKTLNEVMEISDVRKYLV